MIYKFVFYCKLPPHTAHIRCNFLFFLQLPSAHQVEFSKDSRS